MPERLTQKKVEAIRPVGEGGKPYVVRDALCVGLLLKVGRTGKAWALQRDLPASAGAKHGNTVRLTLGSTDAWTLDAARDWASPILLGIKKGIRPGEDARPRPAKASPAQQTVRQLVTAYASHLDAQGRDGKGVRDRLRLWLDPIADRKLADLKKADCRKLHADLTPKGQRAADHAMETLRAAWKWLDKIAEEDDAVPSCPVSGVTFHRPEGAKVTIPERHLPDWYARCQTIADPMRRLMHLFGLFSGARVENVVALRREWVDLPANRINYPAEAMKNGDAFTLPLSPQLKDIVQKALTLGDIQFPQGTEWVFPSAGSSSGHHENVQQRELKGQTGLVLRRTWRTIAAMTDVPFLRAEVLHAHRVKGIADHYISVAEMFATLLADQTKISDAISGKIGMSKPKSGLDGAS